MLDTCYHYVRMKAHFKLGISITTCIHEMARRNVNMWDETFHQLLAIMRIIHQLQ